MSAPFIPDMADEQPRSRLTPIYHRPKGQTEGSEVMATAPLEYDAEDAMSEYEDEIAANENPMVELAAGTLRGDVRDSLLAWFKAQPKQWSGMSEVEQRDVADAADRHARALVKEACQIIAANERPCIVATLVEYREKDGIEAKLKLPSRGEVVSALHDACGREVLVVTSGAEEFSGEGGPAEIDADQPDLGIGAEYEDA